MCDNNNCDMQSKPKRKYIRSEEFVLKYGIKPNETEEEKKVRQKENLRVWKYEYNKEYNKINYQKNREKRLEDASKKLYCATCTSYHSKSHMSRHMKSKIHIKNVDQMQKSVDELAVDDIEPGKIIYI